MPLRRSPLPPLHMRSMTGKKFQFSLDRVLKVRQHEAEDAQRVLARRMQERQQQETRVTAARQRLERLGRGIEVGASTGSVSIRRGDAFRQDAQHALDEALQALERQRALEREARQAVLERRRAEEALQTLSDQERARHRKKQDAVETNVLDEQALTGFRRNRASIARRAASVRTTKAPSWHQL